MEDRGTSVYVWVLMPGTPHAKYFFDCSVDVSARLELSVPIGYSLVSTPSGPRLRSIFGTSVSAKDAVEMFKVRSTEIIN